MSPEIIVLASLGSIAILFIGVFWLYQDYRVDSLRHQLFNARDNLFDDALSELVPFDHPAYCMLRETLNGSIRFAHRINFFNVVIIGAIVRKAKDGKEESFAERFEKNISTLSPEGQDAAKKTLVFMGLILARHIVFNSPFVILIPILIATDQVMKLYNWLSNPVDRLESLALAEAGS